MISVKDVYITKEVADKLDINTSYLIRLAKKLIEEGEITEDDMRAAGKRNYLFNGNAIEVLRKTLQQNQNR